MFERRYADFNYLAFISDNDQGDKTGGNVTFSNMQLITDLDSCLEPLGFEFTFDDCSIENVLSAVEEKLIDESCANTDPLLELMALFDATQEMEVYKTIQKTCASAYGPHAYDFTRYLSNEGQLYASSNVFTYPDHHALKNCDIGAAMCCFVTHKDAPLESPAASSPNAEMCYTDIEYSRYSAHVRKGFSVYGEDGTDDVMCHGFAWGTDHGSVDAALAGNALFKIGFMSDFYTSGNIEQVPAVPLCGCIDRMPVVTNAKCSNAVATGSTVVFKYDTALKDLTASFTLGEDGITYGDCGGENLIDHYKTLAADGKADDVAVAYMESRIVGEGGCSAATSAFLGSKYELEFA
ncbi:hypothetical protein THAOC_04165 [Thalassiosira oceanica]|uniref:Uncharacterized protein n=1 Tax=Thalassiosira oceanica TaxID=159749 RepID=K0TAR0_THAOC|nr:hypothetical protein THAOC_04165 [Thalassiosira oceanica]|eukprot:EJK74174.1 hypothetical protein THAOC_04165 [Thalassiosira oceanica]